MGRGKVLFLYSDATGTGQVNRRIDYVRARLESIFDEVSIVKTSSMEEGQRLAIDSCGVYDTLVFSGGDGTFNHIASSLVNRPNAPTIGYVNGGTIGDVGANFGITKNLKKSLDIIEKGYTTGFDMGKIGNQYFVYVAAIGAFADIPYITKRAYKKRIGRIAYYFVAVKEAVIKKKIPCHIEADGKEYDTVTPFLLVLNGKNVGGFPVNERASSIHDGYFELYLTKPGIFNGLLHYLFFKARTIKIKAKSFKIALDYPLPWDLDGEKGPDGSVDIEVVDSGLRIYCRQKYAEE